MTFDNHIHFAAKVLELIRFYEDSHLAEKCSTKIDEEVQAHVPNELASQDKQRVLQKLQDAGFFTATIGNNTCITYRLTWKGLQFLSYYKYVKHTEQFPTGNLHTPASQMLFCFT